MFLSPIAGRSFFFLFLTFLARQSRFETAKSFFLACRKRLNLHGFMHRIWQQVETATVQHSGEKIESVHDHDYKYFLNTEWTTSVITSWFCIHLGRKCRLYLLTSLDSCWHRRFFLRDLRRLPFQSAKKVKNPTFMQLANTKNELKLTTQPGRFFNVPTDEFVQMLATNCWQGQIPLHCHRRNSTRLHNSRRMSRWKHLQPALQRIQKATYMRQLISSFAATANSKTKWGPTSFVSFGTSTMLFFSQAAECMSGFLWRWWWWRCALAMTLWVWWWWGWWCW